MSSAKELALVNKTASWEGLMIINEMVGEGLRQFMRLKEGLKVQLC